MTRLSLPRFAMHELARKDFFFCLGIWLSIEVVCFALLPALRLAQTGGLTKLWFIVSLVLGLGGTGLMALGTQLSALAQGRPPKRTRTILISLLSWLGLIGIAFPLLFMSAQLFGKLFALLKG
jgi:hypothetical protein